MLAGIANGTTRLANFSTGADCASTLACLRQLGCVVRHESGRVEIEGSRWQQPAESLDCGNFGSTMRMLAGLLAGHEFESRLHGDESLSRRPMARVMVPLRLMGAQITGSDGERPPLRIRGGKLNAIEYKTPVASAQVKSAVLLAGLGARISVINLEEQHGELVGTLRIAGGALKGATIQGAQSVALIDELPVLATIAPYTRDGIEIQDAKELRVKESDRIALVAKNLRAMGAACEEREDRLRVPGQQRLRVAEIDSGGDNRTARASALAALGAEGESGIR